MFSKQMNEEFPLQCVHSELVSESTNEMLK